RDCLCDSNARRARPIHRGAAKLTITMRRDRKSRIAKMPRTDTIPIDETNDEIAEIFRTKKEDLMIDQAPEQQPAYELPPLGGNRARAREGTPPASFANKAEIAPGFAGRYTFSSPDTPQMPAPSDKTAWDFMPVDWKLRPGHETNYETHEAWQPPTGF